VGTNLADFLQFTSPVDPYVVPGVPSSGLLPGMQSGTGGVTGAADTKLQAYNYRLCLTNRASNRRPIPAPTGYNEANYELLARHIAARTAAGRPPALTDLLNFGSLPNQKADVNNNGPFSTDYVGGNYDYVTATQAQRAQIAAEHRQYQQGLLFFLSTSTRVPANLRSAMSAWGFAADEFTTNGGWPLQLYVREARRMISDYVMQQGNCTGTRTPTDSAGLGSYSLDSHVVQRLVKNVVVNGQSMATAHNEGIFYVPLSQPYPISLRSILPRQSECENLAVPFALSASHVAFGSIRMEPVLMILSQSAATAAAFAIGAGSAMQQVPYSQVSAQVRSDRQVSARMH